MDRMISEIERARVKYSPKDVDNKEFYEELYSILKEIPKDVWEKIGFNDVDDVRIYPDLSEGKKSAYPINLTATIRYAVSKVFGGMKSDGKS